MNEKKLGPQTAASIVRLCVAHLDSEIELLEEYIKIIQKVYENVGWQKNEIVDSDELLSSIANWSDAISVKRYELKVEISKVLDVPIQQATIRALAQKLSDPDKLKIEQRRGKIVQLESVIQQQNHTNSLLIRQTMDLYQRIATELSGVKAATPTYSPLGELAPNDSSKFLQTDC